MWLLRVHVDAASKHQGYADIFHGCACVHLLVPSLHASRGLDGMALTLEVEPSYDFSKKSKTTHEEEGVSAGTQPSWKCGHPPCKFKSVSHVRVPCFIVWVPSSPSACQYP